MKLTSTSYFDNLNIHAKYCSREMYTGQNISPQYAWTDYPSNVKSFILLLIDRHPKASGFVHWLLTNIPANVNKIPEGASHSSKLPANVQEQTNSYGQMGYGGPQPPKGTGKHIYEAIIFALDTDKISLSGEVNEKQLLAKIKPNILAQASLNGFVVN